MAENFVAEAWSTLAIALVFIFLRLYARISLFGFRKLALDDALMVLAGLSYTAETTAAYFIGAYWFGLANSGMTEAQRATLDPSSGEYRLRINGSKTHVVGWFTYTTLMWLLKGCWVIYYSRLTDGVHKMHIRIRVGYVLVAATYLSAILVIIFKCYPFKKQWQIYPDPGNNCQPGFSKLQVSYIMAINTATDLYLMAIPLPMIYKSRLQTKKKITLLVMFSGGFLVMIFGILRCVTLLTVSTLLHKTALSPYSPLLSILGETDPAQSGEWSVRESFVAVVVSNFPMVYPLFQRWYRKIRGQDTKSSSVDPSYRLDSNPRTGRSKKSKNFQHPLSIPNDTAWGSDEAIVLAENGGTV
ncbi:MAG: hypothetical protein M1830_001881, partial [Pleopsidium flavum]